MSIQSLKEVRLALLEKRNERWSEADEAYLTDITAQINAAETEDVPVPEATTGIVVAPE